VDRSRVPFRRDCAPIAGAGDHENLAAGLITAPYRWVLSYDDHPTIRRLYGTAPGLGRYVVGHSYSTTGARRRASASAELLIASTPAPGCGLGTWGEAGDLRLVVVAGERVGGVPAESFVATH